jgi:hypothetical protein
LLVEDQSAMILLLHPAGVSRIRRDHQSYASRRRDAGFEGVDEEIARADLVFIEPNPDAFSGKGRT